MVAKFRAETALPHRTNERMDRLELMCTQSSTESALPSRTLSRTDIEEPMVKKSRMDMLPLKLDLVEWLNIKAR